MTSSSNEVILPVAYLPARSCVTWLHPIASPHARPRDIFTHAHTYFQICTYESFNNFHNPFFDLFHDLFRVWNQETLRSSDVELFTLGRTVLEGNQVRVFPFRCDFDYTWQMRTWLDVRPARPSFFVDNLA